jgi:hypothetical protein
MSAIDEGEGVTQMSNSEQSFEWQPRKWPEEKPDDLTEAVLQWDGHYWWRGAPRYVGAERPYWHPMPPNPEPFIPQHGAVYHHPENPHPTSVSYLWWDGKDWMYAKGHRIEEPHYWRLQPPAPVEK